MYGILDERYTIHYLALLLTEASWVEKSALKADASLIKDPQFYFIRQTLGVLSFSPKLQNVQLFDVKAFLQS